MQRAERSAGFTLIEVLIGTTLIVIMTSLLMGSLYSISRAASAGEVRLDELDSQRLVRAFLRDQIAGAIPLTRRVERQDLVYFDGRRDSLRLVGHLPAHRGGGGLQYLQIEIDGSAEPPALVMRYRDAWVEADFSAPADGQEWQRTVLLHGITGIRCRYFGTDDENVAPHWSDSWSDRAALPSLVRIELESNDVRAWPALSVAIRAPTAAGQARLFVGGG